MYDLNMDGMSDAELEALTAPENEEYAYHEELREEQPTPAETNRKSAKTHSSPSATKLKRLKEEKRKNEEKIGTLQNRNAEIDREIKELQNSDLAAMFESSGLTFEDVVSFLQKNKN